MSQRDFPTLLPIQTEMTFHGPAHEVVGAIHKMLALHGQMLDLLAPVVEMTARSDPPAQRVPTKKEIEEWTAALNNRTPRPPYPEPMQQDPQPSPTCQTEF